MCVFAYVCVCVGGEQDAATPLHVACQNSGVEVVQALLAAGAVVDAPKNVSAVLPLFATRRVCLVSP